MIVDDRPLGDPFHVVPMAGEALAFQFALDAKDVDRRGLFSKNCAPPSWFLAWRWETRGSKDIRLRRKPHQARSAPPSIVLRT